MKNKRIPKKQDIVEFEIYYPKVNLSKKKKHL